MSTRLDIRAPAIVFAERAGPDHTALTGAGGAPNVVIFGSPRGGTTMIAGIAKLCGLDIGANLPDNLEDPAFGYSSPEEMIRIIEERNALKEGAWGWKFPRAAVYLPRIASALRNPHYVVVWRDVLANATRAVRRGEPVVATLRHFHRIQQVNIEVLERLEGRFLLVSYEKSVADPVGLARQIAEFVGLASDIDEQRVIAFAKPGSYKPVGG